MRILRNIFAFLGLLASALAAIAAATGNMTSVRDFYNSWVYGQSSGLEIKDVKAREIFGSPSKNAFLVILTIQKKKESQLSDCVIRFNESKNVHLFVGELMAPLEDPQPTAGQFNVQKGIESVRVAIPVQVEKMPDWETSTAGVTADGHVFIDDSIYLSCSSENSNLEQISIKKPGS